MTPDPLTLYKLMVLYMLRQAKFPLSYSQISELMLGHEYTDHFTLQQALDDLLEAHLVRHDQNRHSTTYEITREGEETLVYFGKDISEGIVDDINVFLRENKLRLRNEVGTRSGYTRTPSGYAVTCEIREGRETLIRLELSAPSEKQAEIMCDNWEKASQSIYAFTVKELLSSDA